MNLQIVDEPNDMTQPLRISHLSTTDDEAAPYLRVVKGEDAPSKQLPIQERINGMDLPAGARDVLVAICTMSEFGKDACLWANNKGVGAQAGCHEKSVPRYLKLLQEQGLVEVTWRGLRRELRPTEEARSHYLGDPILLPRNQRLPRNSNQRLRGNSNERLPQGKPTVTHNLDLELKEKELLLTIAGLEKNVADLEEELQSANAACEQRKGEVLKYKERFDNSVEVYRANQKTIADQAAEILALKAELATPKKTAVARAAKPADPLAGKGSLITAIWREWYRATNHAEAPPCIAPDHTAARNIYIALSQQPDCTSDEAITNLFSALLANWPKLDAWTQKQQKLQQINSNLTNILPQLIHHGKPTAATAIDQAARAQQLGLVAPTRRASLNALRAYGS